MAAGLHWFFKYACRSSISWNVTGGCNIDGSCFTPSCLTILEQQGGMRRGRSVPWHYYQNVVTPRSQPLTCLGLPGILEAPSSPKLVLQFRVVRNSTLLLHVSGPFSSVRAATVGLQPCF